MALCSGRTARGPLSAEPGRVRAWSSVERPWRLRPLRAIWVREASYLDIIDAWDEHVYTTRQLVKTLHKVEGLYTFTRFSVAEPRSTWYLKPRECRCGPMTLPEPAASLWRELRRSARPGARAKWSGHQGGGAPAAELSWPRGGGHRASTGIGLTVPEGTGIHRLDEAARGGTERADLTAPGAVEATTGKNNTRWSSRGAASISQSSTLGRQHEQRARQSKGAR